MRFDIGRIAVAFAIGIIVWLLLVAFIGPVLVALDVPILKTVGDGLIKYAIIIGFLAGVLWYFGRAKLGIGPKSPE